MRVSSWFLSLFFLLNLILSWQVGKLSAEMTLTRYEAKVVEAVEKVRPSVVRIDTYKGSISNPKRGLGSGVIFTKDGYIITNSHVIETAENIVVTLFNGEKYTGILVNYTPEYDIAVLKIEAKGLKPAEFGNSDELKLGQTVIAIGNPLSFGWTVTVGVVSGLHRQMKIGRRIYRNLIQTDAAINKGNSGGPLINTEGKVIGINTIVYRGKGRTEAEGLSFAIPSNTAKYIARKLMERRKMVVTRAWLGIEPLEVTPYIAERYSLPVNYGIYVRNVFPGSPAAKAGIKPGDIIVKIDDQVIDSIAKYKMIINSKRPGDEIVVELFSEFSQKVVVVKLEPKSR